MTLIYAGDSGNHFQLIPIVVSIQCTLAADIDIRPGGWEALSRAKQFFQAIAKFFWRKPAAKKERNSYFCIY